MSDDRMRVLDILEMEAEKLRYLAEAEDKPGLSNILLDIARCLNSVKHMWIPESKQGGNENGKAI